MSSSTAPELASAESTHGAAVSDGAPCDADVTRIFPSGRRLLPRRWRRVRRVGRRRLVEKFLKQRDEAQPVGAREVVREEGGAAAPAKRCSGRYSATALSAARDASPPSLATSRCAHASSASKPAVARAAVKSGSSAARTPRAAVLWQQHERAAQERRPRVRARVARKAVARANIARVWICHQHCVGRAAESAPRAASSSAARQLPTDAAAARARPAACRRRTRKMGSVPAKRRRPKDASGKSSTTELMALSMPRTWTSRQARYSR